MITPNQKIPNYGRSNGRESLQWDEMGAWLMAMVRIEATQTKYHRTTGKAGPGFNLEH